MAIMALDPGTMIVTAEHSGALPHGVRCPQPVVPPGSGALVVWHRGSGLVEGLV